MIYIIILLIFLITFMLQEKFFKNKNKYKNIYVQYYQDLKIPIFVSCVVTIIYSMQCNKTDNFKMNLRQPTF